MNEHPGVILAVRTGLQLASCYDQRAPRPDKPVILAWMTILGPLEATKPEVQAAVADYYAEPRDRVIQAGDVAAHIRTHRRRTTNATTLTRRRIELAEKRSDALADGDHIRAQKALTALRELPRFA